MLLPTNRKKIQAFLGLVCFWRLHIPDYSLMVSPVHQVTWKKNAFKLSPGWQQAFEETKQEIMHAVTLQQVQAVK